MESFPFSYCVAQVHPLRRVELGRTVSKTDQPPRDHPFVLTSLGTSHEQVSSNLSSVVGTM